MKIIFFGLGSIGQRHARLLLKNFNHSVFAYRSGNSSLANKLGIKELHSWDQVRRLSPHVAFITNPTYLHIKTTIKCARLGINLFIEKPIDCRTDELSELISLVNKKNLVAYVAYCMRFNPVIKKIYQNLKGRNSLHCNIVASSYLPGWRAGRDYKTIYSAKRKKGGGVILDLSHEIDYSSYLFGDVLKINGEYGKLSDLKVDSEDYADIFMQCEKGVVNLHLNFFSKNAERSIRIDFKNSDYINADLLKNTLIISRNGNVRKYKYSQDRENMYSEQLKYFFKNFHNKKMMNNLKDANKLFRRIMAFKNKK